MGIPSLLQTQQRCQPASAACPTQAVYELSRGYPLQASCLSTACENPQVLTVQYLTRMIPPDNMNHGESRRESRSASPNPSESPRYNSAIACESVRI